MDAILTNVGDEMQSSWSEDWDWVVYYNWTGTPGSSSPPVDNDGTGEPKKMNGLVGCTHRPSDDRTIFSELGHVQRGLHAH